MKVSSLLVALSILIGACSAGTQPEDKTLELPSILQHSEETRAQIEQSRSFQQILPSENWHLKTPGRPDGALGTGAEKWAQSQPSTDSETPLIVAVLDSGIDLQHPALTPYIFENQIEAQGAPGVDDDSNGIVDDIHGWNFLGDSEKSFLDLPQENVRLLKHLREAAALAPDDDEINAQCEALENSIKTQREEIKNHISQVRESITNGGGRYGETVDYLIRVKSALERTIEFNLSPDASDPAGDGLARGNPDLCPQQQCAHGTHVTGIVLSQALGRVPGDFPHETPQWIKILPIRVVPRSGDEPDAAVAAGIRYAIRTGAKIVQMSFGKTLSTRSDLVVQALEEAKNAGVLIVHSAGNEATLLDRPDAPMYYPRRHSPELSWLEVGATTEDSAPEKILAPFTNSGKSRVDLFAPGVHIHSTLPGGTYGRMSGTSMAAPMVTGVAARLWAEQPGSNAAEMRAQVLQAVHKPVLSKPVSLPGISLGLVRPPEQAHWDDLSLSGGILQVR